jgi:hypothetical protein
MRPSLTLSLIWGSPVVPEDLRVFDKVEEDIGRQSRGFQKITSQQLISGHHSAGSRK